MVGRLAHSGSEPFNYAVPILSWNPAIWGYVSLILV